MVGGAENLEEFELLDQSVIILPEAGNFVLPVAGGLAWRWALWAV